MHRPARLLAPCLLAALSLAGCFRPHFTQPVEIEVFDAITREPVAGARIDHGAPTGKFQATIQESATADAAGVATIASIRLVDDSWWQIARSDACGAPQGPYYAGEGWSQIPRAFEEVEKVDGRRRFRAPLWPAIRAVVELPAGFRGVFAWVAVDTDAAPDAGWLPPADLLPARLEEGAAFRAALRPDAAGVIAHPMSVGGVRGYGPINFDGSRSPIVRLGGERLDVVEAGSEVVIRRVLRSGSEPQGRLEIVPLDAAVVRAWRLWSWRVPGEPISASRPRDAWFVGSLDDLRAWLEANGLRPLNPNSGLRLDSEDRAARRVYAAHALAPLIPRASAPSAAPAWSVVRHTAAR